MVGSFESRRCETRMLKWEKEENRSRIRKQLPRRDQEKIQETIMKGKLNSRKETRLRIKGIGEAFKHKRIQNPRLILYFTYAVAMVQVDVGWKISLPKITNQHSTTSCPHLHQEVQNPANRNDYTTHNSQVINICFSDSVIKQSLANNGWVSVNFRALWL